MVTSSQKHHPAQPWSPRRPASFFLLEQRRIRIIKQGLVAESEIDGGGSATAHV
jgi:hypothetical protein